MILLASSFNVSSINAELTEVKISCDQSSLLHLEISIWKMEGFQKPGFLKTTGFWTKIVGTTEIKRLLTLILLVHLLAKNLKSGQKHGFCPLKFDSPILPVSNGNGILTTYYPCIPLYPLCTPFIPHPTPSYPVIPSIIATYRVLSIWWKFSCFHNPRFRFHWKFPWPHGKEWNRTLDQSHIPADQETTK
jgi:hypothetical protein